MSLFPTRFRTRRSNHPYGGKSVYLGKFQIKISGEWRTWAGDPSLGYHPNGCPSTINYPFLKEESTRDELHPGPPYKSGGEFYNIKLACEEPNLGVGMGTYDSGSLVVPISGYGQGPIRYIGYFTNPNFSGLGLPDFNQSKTLLAVNSSLITNIQTLCDSAWSKTKPRIERAGLGIAIKESTDIHRMLQTSSKVFSNIWKDTLRKSLNTSGTSKSFQKFLSLREMAPKKAADHFINHNFGWVPFVKDVTSFFDVIINTDDILQRISDENARFVRRRATLVDDYKVTKVNSGTGYRVEPFGAYIDYLCNGTPTWELWLEEITMASSVGSFVYYRPEFDRKDPGYHSLINTLSRQMTIHGVRISPSNIYKAIPWSWAIDWFSNVGKHIELVSDEFMDSMAARYLFVSHRKYQRYILKQHIPFKSGPRTFEFSRLVEVKQRRAANTPYGFGLTWDNLSPKQLAILGALGISRW